MGAAAARTGSTPADLRRLIELGILAPDADGRLTTGDVRRIGLVQSMVAAGIPLDGLSAAIRSGQVSMGFIDAPAFDRFVSPIDITFAQLAEERGLPVELLTFIREAAGSSPPDPGDRVRDEELPYVDLIEVQFKAGFGRSSIQRMVRVEGDGLRRIAETQSAMWQHEVIEPGIAAGMRPDETLGNEFGNRMSVMAERAVVAMYHMQQTRAWTTGIIEGLEAMLASAGLHTRAEHPPAMCFFDITGYTRLTQERGDEAAADLAERLGRLVQRESVRHGGRAVKWLGDGVMLHFPNPGHGVAAALDMVHGVIEADLPPAHVGLHAGPVIFQEGDYYGQTVNLAARIAAHADPGQVLVSQTVVDACGDEEVAFSEIGAVELKGVAGTTQLFAAARPR